MEPSGLSSVGRVLWGVGVELGGRLVGGRGDTQASAERTCLGRRRGQRRQREGWEGPGLSGELLQEALCGA